MSVHQESLSNPRVMEPLEDDSSEYAEGRNESLSLFGAALGGALLGMLLTLLVLAVLNNGSLRFDTAAGSERAAADRGPGRRAGRERAQRQRERADCHANLSGDIEQGQSEIRGQVDTIVSELDGQGLTLSELGETLGSLEQTRDEFNIFVGALNEALSAIEAGEEMSAPATISEGTAGTAVEDSAAADVPIASTIQPLVETRRAGADQRRGRALLPLMPTATASLTRAKAPSRGCPSCCWTRMAKRFPAPPPAMQACSSATCPTATTPLL